MAKTARGRRRLSSHLRPTPYPLPSCHRRLHKKKDKSKSPIKKDWEDATCSVCMEFPHNAVLLLCSSHDKGCRPYMCGTSYRHSNCLDRFKNACMKVENGGISGGISTWPLGGMSEIAELACPLCRGKVWGCTVVEPAREYLNMKKRCCTQDGCSFAGTYKELRKHVRAEHPSAKPRQVDPSLEQKWRRLEHEREREDVLSTIRSSMPGAMVFGDYVIDRSGFDSDDDGEFDGEGDHIGRGGLSGYVGVLDYLFSQAIGNSGNGSFASRLRRSQRNYRGLDEVGGGRLAWLPTITTQLPLHAISDDDDDDEDDDDDGDNDDEVMADLTRQGRGDRVSRAVRRRRRHRSRSSRLGIGLT